MKPYFLLFLMMLLSCNSNKTPFNIDEVYQTAFKENLLERAKNRVNYLQLTGLFKLDSLTNTFGSDPGNNFTINIKSLPPKIGAISVFKDSLVFNASEDIEVRNKEDSIIKNYYLELNEYGSSAKLYYKQLNWQVITRSGKYYLRIWDTKNPAIEAFKGFELFKLNSKFIIEGQFSYYENTKSEIVKSEIDGKRSTKFIGKVVFEYNGETHDLEVGEDGFTMVSDQTTGDETYGGGRYIYLDLPETDGLIKLDFNYLYNPPCAFSEFTTCLYPPRQNSLPFKILAGEKIYK